MRTEQNSKSENSKELLALAGMPKSVQEEMSKALGPAMKKLHNQEIGHNSPRAN